MGPSMLMTEDVAFADTFAFFAFLALAGFALPSFFTAFFCLAFFVGERFAFLFVCFATFFALDFTLVFLVFRAISHFPFSRSRFLSPPQTLRKRFGALASIARNKFSQMAIAHIGNAAPKSSRHCWVVMRKAEGICHCNRMKAARSRHPYYPPMTTPTRCPIMNVAAAAV